MKHASPIPRHPAPHRHRAGGALAFALLAAPLAWLAQISVNYGVASHACYPGAEPFLVMVAQWPWPVVTAVNILSLVVAVTGSAIAYRTWQLTRGEASGDIGKTVEAGEGRTRFLSVWGILASAGFAIALLFSLVAIVGVPPCGYA